MSARVYEGLLIGEQGQPAGRRRYGARPAGSHAVCLPDLSHPVKMALNRQIVTLAQHGL